MSPGYPQILSPEDSSFWRQAYIEVFIDTNSEHYQPYIATLHQCPDGEYYYHGCLWDFLRGPSRITHQRLRLEVANFNEIYVMADHHFHSKIVVDPPWPYPPHSVAVFTPQILLNMLPKLPEDLYIFDSSVSWTLVFTHEHDNKRRLCCAVGIAN